MSEGYFPAGSMLRHVQEHRTVGQTYGQRALIVGATHPVPYVGTSASTNAKERPFMRLSATAEAFESIFFGDRAEADKVLAMVHQMHTKVRGTLDRDEGNFPAGTAYDAFDPELMLWTMAMLADSSRVAFETLVRRLEPDEKERLWADWIRFGELFGMPRSVAPATARDFEEWMRAQIAGPDFHVTEEARVVGRAIALDMPVPLQLRIGITGTNLVVRGMLPPRVRTAFGLAWSPAHAAAYAGICAGVRASQRVMPDEARLGRNTGLFRLVTATERRIIARGGRTMELPAA